MKSIERILFKIAVVHMIMLVGIQLLFHYVHIEPYVSKTVRYEGVNQIKIEEWIETFKN
ncbi:MULTISPECIES: YpfB family protein [Bacillus]|uniref:YpfB family protein n=1 Tax=Bacillus capparidis TaxID=1840411 RepID=A0ABS4CSB8_9BACI|nr:MULTISPECIES: YpfB family protein [Bacillus]MBP1080469.1 hypothetical protein [Bacillus capparidis]MED1094326.1 YpfB family protein [Bacillus capparidis]